jgi:hypothetical protein
VSSASIRDLPNSLSLFYSLSAGLRLAAALQEDEDEQLLDNNSSKDNAASASASPHHEKSSAIKASKKPTKYKKNPNAPKRFRRYVLRLDVLRISFTAVFCRLLTSILTPILL